MASAKSEDSASTPNSSHTNDAAKTIESTVVSAVEMNIEKTIVVAGSTDNVDDVEHVNGEANPLAAVNNEEVEKEEENATAEEESDEENAGEEDAGEGDDEDNELGEGEKEEEEEDTEGVGEEEEEADVGEAHKAQEVEVKPEEKARKPRKRNRKKKVGQKSSEIVAVDGDKPESSNKKKGSKRVEGMGMIFMCSSKTKTDCFRYKVLGLPAGKKDQVQKIYKGMRLFLFDFELRLMYGIFKAAAPGGYNIEPKAFKSAFPSQVRFTVLEDSLPLAEEKFKKVLKENYYSRNKFDCQLTSEQVKKLCKLFTVASKGRTSKAVGKSRKAETHASEVDQGRRKRRAWDEEQHSVLGREQKYRERPVAPPWRPPHFSAPAPAPAPVPSYVYERPLERDLYPREPVLEHRGLRYADSEPRRRDEIVVRDPYVLYREAPSYRDSVYSVGRPLQYAPPTALPLEHRYVGRDYHAAAGREAEYHPSGSLHPEYRVVEPTTRYYSSSGSVPEYQSGRTIYRY